MARWIYPVRLPNGTAIQGVMGVVLQHPLVHRGRHTVEYCVNMSCRFSVIQTAVFLASQAELFHRLYHVFLGWTHSGLHADYLAWAVQYPLGHGAACAGDYV
ncbi:hypothetical protein D3C74_398280 [compost metagenome]